MLSRVADSLYWMSRYMERSDGIIRMLKVNYASSQESAMLSRERQQQERTAAYA